MKRMHLLSLLTAVTLLGSVALTLAQPAPAPADDDVFDEPAPPSPESAPATRPAEPATQPAKPGFTMDQVSYIAGHNFGMMVHSQKVELQMKAFLDGLKDGMAGKDAAIKPEEAQKVMEAFQKHLAAQAQKRYEALSAKNKAEGDAFLKTNAAAEGVKVTASGLQYKVITEGKGPKIGPEDTVSIHYVGTLINGEEFDRSDRTKEPPTFQPQYVFPALGEGVQLMRQGAKYVLYMPPKLTAGLRLDPEKVGPDAVLIFTVDVVKVVPAEKAPVTTWPAKDPKTGRTAPAPEPEPEPAPAPEGGDGS